MGNKVSKKGKKTNDKTEKAPSKADDDDDDDEVDVEVEAQAFWTLGIIFELNNGSTSNPEKIDVTPSLTLEKLKEDVKQKLRIDKKMDISIRRDNRDDVLAPNHLTLEALQIKNRNNLLVREL